MWYDTAGNYGAFQKEQTHRETLRRTHIRIINTIHIHNQRKSYGVPTNKPEGPVTQFSTVHRDFFLISMEIYCIQTEGKASLCLQ